MSHRVLLVQMYCNDASRAAVEELGHEARAVEMRAFRVDDGELFEWPDVVIVQQGDQRDRRTCLPVSLVDEWRRRGARVVWWTYDPPPAKRAIYERFALACDELIVCTQSDFEYFSALHERVRLDYVGVDERFWRPVEPTLEERQRLGCYDVSLVGHLYPNRYWLLGALLSSGYRVAQFGRGGAQPWLSWLDVRLLWRLTPVNVVLPYQWGERQDEGYLICRHFEIPASGGFAVAVDTDAVRKALPAMPTWRNLNDLKRLIEIALGNTSWQEGTVDGECWRQRSIELCRETVIRDWTLKAFFARILGKEAKDEELRQ